MEFLRELRKPTDEVVELIAYKNRAVVKIIKIPMKTKSTIRRRYRYNVTTHFMYNGREQVTKYGMTLKKALTYASDIFTSRDVYMLKNNLRLPEEGTHV